MEGVFQVRSILRSESESFGAEALLCLVAYLYAVLRIHGKHMEGAVAQDRPS